MPFKHTYASPVTDDGDPNEVGPSEWNDLHLADISLGTESRDECWFQATTDRHDGNVGQVVTGTAAATSAGTADSGHPGVIRCSSGSTASGQCALGGAGSPGLILGGGEYRQATVFKIIALSDGTQSFRCRIGLVDAFASNPATNEVVFRYTHSVNSGMWQAVTRAAGSETVSDTGVTADTNWHRYEIVVNADRTEVKFYIDGTLVATSSATIPSAPVTQVVGQIQKTLGSTARTVDIDAYYWQHRFTTPR